jgi:hypothetical protein
MPNKKAVNDKARFMLRIFTRESAEPFIGIFLIL